MKAFLIFVLMSFGPQGEEVVQSVHLTRAECQASLGKIATNVIIVPNFVTDPQRILGPDPIGPIQANGLVQISPQPIGIPPEPEFRPGIKGASNDRHMPPTGDAKCVQFRVER